MAKTSVITTHVTICGDGVDFTWHQGDEPFCNPNAPEGGTTSAVLAPGSNTIAVPPGALWLSVGALVGSTNAKALRFTSGGTVVFAGHVEHPGSKKNEFVQRAIRSVILESVTL